MVDQSNEPEPPFLRRLRRHLLDNQKLFHTQKVETGSGADQNQNQIPTNKARLGLINTLTTFNSKLFLLEYHDAKQKTEVILIIKMYFVRENGIKN